MLRTGAATFPTPEMKDSGERAPRFEFDLPFRYRSAGEKEWHDGVTENISRSGVLFRTTHLLQVDTPVEMSFTLPAGPSSAAIRCRGRVVRTLPPARGQSPPGMAATISAYRFVRPPAPR